MLLFSELDLLDHPCKYVVAHILELGISLCFWVIVSISISLFL